MNNNENINNYLEIDDNIIKELNYEYLDKTIYIIQYPEGELSVSYGILDKIYEDKNIILIINVLQKKDHQAHQY